MTAGLPNQTPVDPRRRTRGPVRIGHSIREARVATASGGPTVIGPKAVRLVTLRPRLSTGLPLSNAQHQDEGMACARRASRME